MRCKRCGEEVVGIPDARYPELNLASVSVGWGMGRLFCSLIEGVGPPHTIKEVDVVKEILSNYNDEM